MYFMSGTNVVEYLVKRSAPFLNLSSELIVKSLELVWVWLSHVARLRPRVVSFTLSRLWKKDVIFG
jgi:hypothetical protein